MKKSIQNLLLEDGEFLVNGRIIKRSTSSLICKFTNKNKMRKKSILITENKWFDNFIMLCIVINSICMASFDYIADNKCAYEKIHSGGCKMESSLNKSLGYAG